MLTKEQKEQYIKELAAELPPWAYNAGATFEPGKTPVYYSGPYFDEKEMEAALKTFIMGKWLVTGTEVAKFQWKFARRFNVGHAHMVNSGSSANLVMLAALKKYYGWTEYTEILVSPVGFPTTIAPIVQNGMKPVFVDIEMNSLNFDLDKLEASITQDTRAIFVSPVLGNPPDMDRLSEISDLYGLVLIGDNCDSLGSKWRGDNITDFYDAWSCSFYPAHHITTGEGGMICSNNEEIVNLARSISWWGRDCVCIGQANLKPEGSCGKRFCNWLPNYDGIVDHKYVFANMGYNLKPLDLQGSMGIVQLEKFDEIHARRRNSYEKISALIERYVADFEGMRQARVVREAEEAETSWFGVPIVCDTPETKTKLQAHFEAHKIQTRNYFAGNILLHPGYSHLGNYRDFPYANLALSHVFFVGAAPHYTDEIFDYFEEVLKKWNP